MKIRAALVRLALLGLLTISDSVVPGVSSADCFFPPKGRIVAVSAQSCEVIDGRTNVEVLRYVGANSHFAELEKLYTGALITIGHDQRWVYPSNEKDPCRKFAQGSRVKMRAYLTCCDTGRWGKCVFGGRWLGDLDGKPIDSDQ